MFIIDGTSILKSIFVLLPMLVSECHPVFTRALSLVRAYLVSGSCVSRSRCDRLSFQMRSSLVPDAIVSRPVCADKS